MSDLSLEQVNEALTEVLNHFGPQELADGAHGHLTWLHDLVKSCLEDPQ